MWIFFCPVSQYVEKYRSLSLVKYITNLIFVEKSLCYAILNFDHTFKFCVLAKLLLIYISTEKKDQSCIDLTYHQDTKNENQVNDNRLFKKQSVNLDKIVQIYLHKLIFVFQISRFLVVDPSKRITAEEALNHPFFQLEEVRKITS